MRWDLRTGRSDVYTIDGSLSAAGDKGWILVRTPTTPGEVTNDQLVAVSPGGEAHALPAPEGGKGFSVRGLWISGDGRTILGQVAFGAGDTRPVIWQCT